MLFHGESFTLLQHNGRSRGSSPRLSKHQNIPGREDFGLADSRFKSGSWGSFGSGLSKTSSDLSSLYYGPMVDTERLEESRLPGACRCLPFLEALNLALDAFEQHTVDRQLTLSGQAVFVCSANHGVVYTKRRLLELTKKYKFFLSYR